MKLSSNKNDRELIGGVILGFVAIVISGIGISLSSEKATTIDVLIYCFAIPLHCMGYMVIIGSVGSWSLEKLKVIRKNKEGNKNEENS